MRQVLKGSINVSVDVYIIDSTDGTPELGVLFNTAGMDLEYRREGAAVVDITEATLAALTTAHADGGFLEIGHGYYRLDLPDAAVATGAETVSIQGTVTGMIVLPQTIQLVDFDPEDGVRLGLTALPNAAADAALGLPISDAGGLDLDTKLANTNEVTVARMGALTDWINGGRLDLILDTLALEATVAALNNISTAQVNTEVDNALDTALTEIAQGVPSATPGLRDAVMLMYMALRNKLDVTTSGADFLEVHNDAGTVITKKALTDSAGDYSEAKMITGL
jgi:hypothetical protein